MGAVRDLFGDILSPTVYTGRTAAPVCLLGISLFVILHGEADRGGTRGGSGRAARQDVNLKPLRFGFRRNVRSCYCSPLFVFLPAALWLIEYSEKAGDLDSIMPPTSTPPRRITKEPPPPTCLKPPLKRRFIFFPSAEPLCVAALQKREKEKKRKKPVRPFQREDNINHLLSFSLCVWAGRIV